jgi:hypothetical protein
MDELIAQKGTMSESASITDYFLPVADFCKSLKLRWQWRRLRWTVAAASEAAQGHEANGVRPGSQEFKTLYNEVAKNVQDYSLASGIPIDSLKAKLPALCAIERLARPDPVVRQNKIGLTLGIIITAALGSAGVGVLAGLGAGMAHWIAHLFA